MGRIVTAVRVENPMDASRHILCDALVDTGASNLVLPAAWKSRLGDLASSQDPRLHPLEQSQAAVDMLGHRLIPVKHLDLK